MPEDPRPNILWYCTDQQRHDTIHRLGNEHINTPVLDSLTETGTAFTRAYTQSTICTPSRASFLTGRYPATHHVHRNGNAYFPDTETLVTKLLADADYDCGLIGKLHLSSAAHRLEKRPAADGYRFFQWSHHPNPDYPEGHDYADWLAHEKGVDPVSLYGGLQENIGPGVPGELHQTTWCSEMAIRFIREERQGPWLLSVNPFDPHPPFDPPQEYLDRYNPEELPYPMFQESDLEHQKHFCGIDQQTRHAQNPYQPANTEPNSEVTRGDMGSVPPAAYDARMVKACYYAMIEQIDEQLGRIISVLKETGQYENTIIVFTSDHGELLGDHGLIYKGCRFYEGLTHVPLIISWPAAVTANVASHALVELVDLAPTLLEAAGETVPAYMQGTSLLPLLQGRADSDHHKDSVISEYHGAVGGPAMPDQTHGFMYFDGRYKVCIYEGHDVGEIYDLDADPGEFCNLWFAPEHSELKADLLWRAAQRYLSTSGPGVERIGRY